MGTPQRLRQSNKQNVLQSVAQISWRRCKPRDKACRTRIMTRSWRCSRGVKRTTTLSSGGVTRPNFSIVYISDFKNTRAQTFENLCQQEGASAQDKYRQRLAHSEAIPSSPPHTQAQEEEEQSYPVIWEPFDPPCPASPYGEPPTNPSSSLSIS